MAPSRSPRSTRRNVEQHGGRRDAGRRGACAGPAFASASARVAQRLDHAERAVIEPAQEQVQVGREIDLPLPGTRANATDQHWHRHRLPVQRHLRGRAEHEQWRRFGGLTGGRRGLDERSELRLQPLLQRGIEADVMVRRQYEQPARLVLDRSHDLRLLVGTGCDEGPSRMRLARYIRRQHEQRAKPEPGRAAATGATRRTPSCHHPSPTRPSAGRAVV